MAFNPNEIMALQDLIAPDTEEEVEQYVSGSVLNPGTVMGEGEKKEQAKPYAKVEAKVYERGIHNVKEGAQKEAEEQKKKEEDEVLQKRKAETKIWKQEEVNDFDLAHMAEGRMQPEFDIVYKQAVGTEDVFLGLSGKSQSSIDCEALLVKIKLPDTKYKEIVLDVQKQTISVQTPIYFLHHILPYPVEKDKGKAQWDADKGLLSVTLAIIKKTIMDEINDKF